VWCARSRNFLAPFGVARQGRWHAAKAGRLAQSANAAVRGMAVDGFAFDPKSENLANLIEQVPALKNPVTVVSDITGMTAGERDAAGDV